jgi:hypothetical protein
MSESQEFGFSRELSNAERAAVCRALSGGGNHGLADCIGEEIPVTIGLVHVVEEIDERGNPLQSKRLALVTDSGEVIGSTSRSAIESWQTIQKHFGLPPYSPPLKIRVVGIKTKKGRETIVLHVY